MSINKLVDSGQVYIIGQYEVGTTKPTSYYKIGIVQNDRSSEARVNEHQTGNPNRLFIAKKIECEASYMVEQQMHRKWNGVRVGKEWFNLANPNDLVTVEQDINNFESQYGPKIVQLRPIYYTTPSPGSNPTLSQADQTRAEQIREDAFILTEKLGLYKFLYTTLEYQIKIANGTQPIMDSVTTATFKPSETKFSATKLPAQLKAKFMNKPRKNKDDFRFNFAGVSANIDSLKLDDAYWKKRYPVEFAAWSKEKSDWSMMNAAITHSSTNYSIRPRTTAVEQLHQEFLEAKDTFETLRVELEMLKLECKILCGPYEKIEEVCTWKRASQTDEFNLKEFQLACPAEYSDPAHYSTTKESVSIKVVPYKTYA